MKSHISGFMIFIFLLMYCDLSFAQDKILLKEKPGTFILTNGPLNRQGPDPYFKSCSYTKAESDAATKNLVSLVDNFCRTPVLNIIKGFDGYCSLKGGRCNTKFGYGLPSTVCFFFETWALLKGKEIKQTSEPPQWRFEAKMTEKFCSNGFNMTYYSNEYNPTNHVFCEKGMDEATIALCELYFLPRVGSIQKSVSFSFLQGYALKP